MSQAAFSACHDRALRMFHVPLRKLRKTLRCNSSDDALTASVTRVTALVDYARLLSEPGAADVDLLSAVVQIARHADPGGVDATAIEAQLDELAAAAAAQLPVDTSAWYPLRVLRVINATLYKNGGFRGAGLEVAARLGLTLHGVNLPAHFMLKPQGLGMLVDAHAGDVIFAEDAEEKLGALLGMQVKLDPGWFEPSAPPLAPQAFLLRWLNNLRQVYVSTARNEQALAIIRFQRATLDPSSLGNAPQLPEDGDTSPQQQPPQVSSDTAPGRCQPYDTAGGTGSTASGSLAAYAAGAPHALQLAALLRDEAMCLLQLGRRAEGLQLLRSYLVLAPDAPDALRVRAMLTVASSGDASGAQAVLGGDGASVVDGSSSSDEQDECRGQDTEA